MSDDLTIDDLTVVGIDGIRRSFDEHYDTTMCVEQDPTGAHHAIQTQHARIEELEKACKEWADVSQSNYQRAKAAEAKLAKAVESLVVINALDPEGLVDGCSNSALKGIVLRMGEIARTTLAELKGEQP